MTLGTDNHSSQDKRFKEMSRHTRTRVLNVEPIEDGKLHDLARRHGRQAYRCTILTGSGPTNVSYGIQAKGHVRDMIAQAEADNFANQIQRSGAVQYGRYIATLLFQ